MHTVSFFRRSLRHCVFGFLAAAALCVPAATADDQPNFIIVMTNAQGWGDAGCAGHPRLQTPDLDATGWSGRPQRTRRVLDKVIENRGKGCPTH